MMLFLDTEFTNFEGDLLSIALVSENGDEWYEEVFLEDYQWKKTNEWVWANVIPKLTGPTIQRTLPDITKSLVKFLRQYKDGVVIVADWPEDFVHFNKLLLTGPGRSVMRSLPTISMHYVMNLKPNPKNPHQALSDAHALRIAFLIEEEGL